MNLAQIFCDISTGYSDLTSKESQVAEENVQFVYGAKADIHSSAIGRIDKYSQLFTPSLLVHSCIQRALGVIGYPSLCIST